MPRLLRAIAVAGLLFAATGAARADAAPLSLVSVGSFSQPTYVTAAPGDPSRLYVVERAGTVKVLKDGVSKTFLDISPLVLTDGERGLLSIAFAPDFATSRRFYAYYTGKTPGAGDVTIARFVAAGPDGAPATPEVLLTVPHTEQSNHDGGQLQFGPDGFLYAGTGDGGAGGDPARNGQNLESSSPAVAGGVNHDPLLAKLLRLDVSGANGYTTPPSNAFGPASKKPEIWAYGVRNPYRFSFDFATGDLLVGDVGQNAREEVDLLPAGTAAGTNLGWSAWEGTKGSGTRDGFTFPVLEYGHDQAPFGTTTGCSVTGGYVVRDPQVPELAGQYVYADYCGSTLRAARLTASGSTEDRELPIGVDSPISFGEDACGRVYVASQGGTVRRIVSGGGDCVTPRVAVPGAPGVPGGSVGAPPPAPSAAGKRAPVLTIRGGAPQRALANGGIRLTLTCDVVCDVRAGGLYLSGREKPGAIPRRVLQQRRERLDAGARVRVTLRSSLATRTVVARLLRRGRSITARVVIRAMPAGGGPTTTRVVRVRVRR